MDVNNQFTGLLLAEGATIHGAVLLESGVNIWYHAEIDGSTGEVSIGEHTNVQDHAKVTGPVKIGRACTIGHGASLQGCTVGDHTLIGIGSIISEHVQIGNNCIIGASSYLMPGMKVPDGMMVLGNPAKVIRPLTQADIEENQEYIHKYDLNVQRYLHGE